MCMVFACMIYACRCISCRTIKAEKQAEPNPSSERVAIRDMKRGKDAGKAVGGEEGQSAPSASSKGSKRKARKVATEEEPAVAPKRRAKKSKK